MYITIESLGELKFAVERVNLPKKPASPVSFTLLTTPAVDPALTGIIDLKSDDDMDLASYNIGDYLRYAINVLDETSGKCILLLTNEEIVEPVEPEPPDPAVLLAQAKANKTSEVKNAKETTVANGIDVETTYGKEHFQLTNSDINYITAIYSMIMGGATEYPYHPTNTDGMTSSCVSYNAEDWTKIVTGAFSFITYNETYCNMLLQWIARETNQTIVDGIFYGCDLPEDLATYMAMVLKTASSAITPNTSNENTDTTEPGASDSTLTGEETTA